MYYEPGLTPHGLPHDPFKALIAPKQQKGIAFVMPNAKSEASVLAFSLSIDALEAKINRDLFYQLPNDLEHKMESIVHVWP